MKTLTPETISSVEEEVKKRLRKRDLNGVEYGNAYGIMLGLEILDYGRLVKSSQLDGTGCGFAQREQNLWWWFDRMLKEVIAETTL